MGHTACREILKEMEKRKTFSNRQPGKLEYSAADGHIYRDVILLNVLKYLNSTELLTGQTDLNKMDTTGFGYRAINIEASLQNGKILYQ